MAKKNGNKVKLSAHKTKIVCTIGPSSNSPEILKEMIRNGMNVARLNFSFGTLSEHKRNIRNIRSAAEKVNQRVSILIDLPGSKIRIGKLQTEPLMLTKGSTVTLTTEPVEGTSALLPVNYAQLPKSLSKGGIVFLSDGFIQLRVKEILKDGASCKVIMGGPLYSSKGVSLPGANLYVDSVTTQDLEFVDFGLTEKVTTFGASFIQNAQDVQKVKDRAKEKGKSIHVVAKIERRDAVKNFKEILAVSDAVMVARGDLGLDIPIEQVPAIQKQLIHHANLAGRPVITATQMLESMKENTRPTRAEVADVANAIIDGTDAVMLSEETAVGHYPIETLKMMRRIATAIERKRDVIHQTCHLRDDVQQAVGKDQRSVTNIISLNVIDAAEALKTRYILTPTASGNTARRVSRFKPNAWVLAFSRNEQTCSFLQFSYGVYPVLMKNPSKSWHRPILEYLDTTKLIKKGDKVLLTQRRFTEQPGGTDSFGVLTIE